jgi:hypothetical protein
MAMPSVSAHNADYVQMLSVAVPLLAALRLPGSAPAAWRADNRFAHRRNCAGYAACAQMATGTQR